MRCLVTAALLLGLDGRAAMAQEVSAAPAQEPATTMLPHPDDARWWVSGQLNVIAQAHASFPSPDQDDNSLRPAREHATSRIWTIFTGVRLRGRTEILVDIESAGGRGLSDALGIAGFTNLDVVRNPTLGSAPYLARAMVHTVIPLGGQTVPVTPGPCGFAAHLPADRTARGPAQSRRFF